MMLKLSKYWRSAWRIQYPNSTFCVHRSLQHSVILVWYSGMSACHVTPACHSTRALNPPLKRHSRMALQHITLALHSCNLLQHDLLKLHSNLLFSGHVKNTNNTMGSEYIMRLINVSVGLGNSFFVSFIYINTIIFVFCITYNEAYIYISRPRHFFLYLYRRIVIFILIYTYCWLLSSPRRSIVYV